MHEDYRDKINEAGKSVCVCVCLRLKLRAIQGCFPKVLLIKLEYKIHNELHHSRNGKAGSLYQGKPWHLIF